MNELEQKLLALFVSEVNKAELAERNHFRFNHVTQGLNRLIACRILKAFAAIEYNLIYVNNSRHKQMALKSGDMVDVVELNNYPLKRMCCEPGLYDGPLTGICFYSFYSSIIIRGFSDRSKWSHPTVIDLYKLLRAHSSEIKKENKDTYTKLKLFVNMMYGLVNAPNSDLKYDIDNFHNKVNYIANRALAKVAGCSDSVLLIDTDIVIFNESVESLMPKLKKSKYPYEIVPYASADIASAKTYTLAQRGLVIA